MSSEALPSDAKLPPVEAFSFDGILRAVGPEIYDSIDSIAEICAKSKLSMADEYSAHLPPQGEIFESEGIFAVPPHRMGLSDRALTTVTEASSSSERLVGSGNSKASTRSGKGKMTAYGSLQNIAVGTARGDATYHKRSASDLIAGMTTHGSLKDGHILWTFRSKASPSILPVTRPVTAQEISVDESSLDYNVTEASLSNGLHAAIDAKSSWVPWKRSPSGGILTATQRKDDDAEKRLKSLLHGQVIKSKESNRTCD